MAQNINEAKLELLMKIYGAIPTDWRHFFEDVAPLLKEGGGNMPPTPAATPLKCCRTCGEYGAACEHPIANCDGCDKWVEKF